jgi:hypothetical protein
MINKKGFQCLILLMISFVITDSIPSRPLAFPGAEGFGRMAVGGRINLLVFEPTDKD